MLPEGYEGVDKKTSLVHENKMLIFFGGGKLTGLLDY